MLLDIQRKAKYPELESFEMPYTVLFSIGTLASALSFVAMSGLLIKQIRKRKQEANEDFIEMQAAFSDQRHKVFSFASRIQDTREKLTFIRVDLMLALLEESGSNRNTCIRWAWFLSLSNMLSYRLLTSKTKSYLNRSLYDIPMTCITLLYVRKLFKLGVVPEMTTLVSMLMSGGMACLKVGKLLFLKGFIDGKKELAIRLSKASSKLSLEERDAVVQWLPKEEQAKVKVTTDVAINMTAKTGKQESVEMLASIEMEPLESADRKSLLGSC